MSIQLNFLLAISIIAALQASSVAFVVRPSAAPIRPSTSTPLFATEADKDKAGLLVSGEELELMLQELDKPLVIDAYATW